MIIPGQDLEFRTANEILPFFRNLISNGELRDRLDSHFDINFASVFQFRNTKSDYVIDLRFDNGNRNELDYDEDLTVEKQTTELSVIALSSKLKLHLFEEKNPDYGTIKRRISIPKTYNFKRLDYRSVRTYDESEAYHDPDYKEEKTVELLVCMDDPLNGHCRPLFQQILPYLRKD